MGPDLGAILAHVPLVNVVHVPLARQRAPEERIARVAVVGEGEVLPGMRRELLAAVAKEVAESLIEVQPAPFQADERDADSRPIERRL